MSEKGDVDDEYAEKNSDPDDDDEEEEDEEVGEDAAEPEVRSWFAAVVFFS